MPAVHPVDEGRDSGRVESKRSGGGTRGKMGSDERRSATQRSPEVPGSIPDKKNGHGFENGFEDNEVNQADAALQFKEDTFAQGSRSSGGGRKSQAGLEHHKKNAVKRSSSKYLMLAEELVERRREHKESQKYQDSLAATNERLKTMQSEFDNTISPAGKFMRRWDLLSMVLLSFTAVVTPYEVGFMETKLDVLFVINRLVDVCFLIDLCLNFNLQYFDSLTGQTVKQRPKIIQNYLKGWFAIDFISILPFDSVGFVTSSSSLENARFLRVLRVLRLAKLMRMLRAKRLFRRLEGAMAIDYAIVRIIGLIANTMILLHWTACIWRLVPVLEGNEASYLDTFGEDNPKELPHFTVYTYTLYFVSATMTSVGYGDVTPVTSNERCLSVLMMLLGAYFFGYIVGNMTNILQMRNTRLMDFYQRMDELNSFMNESNIDMDLRMRLREYLRYKHNNKMSHATDHTEVMAMLNPNLRREVVKVTTSKWFNRIKFFAGMPEEFIIELSMKFRPMVFVPDEWVCEVGEQAETLYVIQRGLVAREGRLYGQGKVFGEDMLLTFSKSIDTSEMAENPALYASPRAGLMSPRSPSPRKSQSQAKAEAGPIGAKGYKELKAKIASSTPFIREWGAKSLTYVHVAVLTKEGLEEMLPNYPEQAMKLRERALRALLKSEVLAYTHAMMKLLTGINMDATNSTSRQTFYYNKLRMIFSTNWRVQERLISSAERIQRSWNAYNMRKRMAGLTKVIAAAIAESSRAEALHENTSKTLNDLVTSYIDPERAERSFGVTQDQLNHADPKKVMLMLSAQVARVQAESAQSTSLLIDRMARFQKEVMLAIATRQPPAPVDTHSRLRGGKSSRNLMK